MAWRIGYAVAAALLLALGGCAATSAPTPSPAASTLLARITGTRVDPAPAQVPLKVGETLTLVVTSDHDDELHAHGFEVETALRAGQPATVSLTGTTPGVYEVETQTRR